MTTDPDISQTSGPDVRQIAATLLGVLGALVCAVSLSIDYFGGAPGTGYKEWLLLGAGGVLILLATLARYGTRENAGDGVRFVGLLIQIAALHTVINLYELESGAFYDFLLGLVASGFVANHFLPASLRPAFFLGLSLVAMFAIMGLLNGAIMLGMGLLLIGIAHLPVSMKLRILLLLLAAVGLGLVRAGVVQSPTLMVILPIFSSIFMFRLVIYLYDISNGKGPSGIFHRLSYFFMLPNFVFPFFPVVDYNAWGRGYYSGRELETYQRGMAFLFFGVIHLLLYRLVNYYLVADPTDVSGFWNFLFYTGANFGLYLKISGLFHTILGCLLLFGYVLPDTHTKFYLSFSFIEFWRRINIYWKDFMQKLVFIPMYSALKKRGASHLQGIIFSITAVFFVTWALHAYQWFWLRGSMLLTGPDAMFWASLGIFLIIQTTMEEQPVRKGAIALIGPRLLLVLRTIATMLTIVILWSMWSSETMAEWFSLLAASGFPLLSSTADWSIVNILQSAGFIAFLIAVFGMALGFTFGLAPPGSHPRKPALRKKPKTIAFASPTVGIFVTCLALVAVQFPSVYGGLSRGVQLFIVDMGAARLSSRDQATLERGYYENLTNVRMINSELWEDHFSRRPDWPLLEESAAVAFVDDYRDFVLRPTIAIPHKGAILSTNSLGMRDQEYTVAKPANTRRIAVVGSSRTMGEGVNDGQTFEALMENALNQSGDVPVEVLNFGVAGYDAFQKQMMLEKIVPDFDADVVLHIAHNNDLDLGRRLARFVGQEQIPYQFMKDMIAESGATADMERDQIERLLKPYASEMVGKIYQQFVDEARNQGAVPVWVFLPSAQSYPEPLPEGTELRRLAEQAGFLVIDLYDVYNGYELDRIWIAPWDNHPNALGHQLISDQLLENLSKFPQVQTALERE